MKRLMLALAPFTSGPAEKASFRVISPVAVPDKKHISDTEHSATNFDAGVTQGITQLRRQTYTLVDLDAIASNVSSLRRKHPHLAGLIAVLKCSAYGHGLCAVAHKLQDQELVQGVLVSRVEEAIELRRSGIHLPILVGAGHFSGSHDQISEYDLTPIIGNQDDLRAFAETAQRRKQSVNAYLEVDVGMARLGFRPEDAESALRQIRAQSAIEIIGVMAHPSLASSKERGAACRQIQRFNKLLENMKSPNAVNGIRADRITRHVATSGTLSSDSSDLLTGQYARIGLCMYGVPISSHDQVSHYLCPALSWYTTVVALRNIDTGATVSYDGAWTAQRPTTIATIAVGYADGYPRSLSNRGQVCINGKRANVVGYVCMDYTMVDVSDIEAVRLGTRATLIGNDNDPSGIEVAKWADTIPYEIVSRISSRVPQVHIG